MSHPADRRVNMPELERLLFVEATPGPWCFSNATDVRGRKGEFRGPSPYNGFMLVGPWVNDADVEIIAALVNAAPALLRALRAFRVVQETEFDFGPGGPRAHEDEAEHMVASAWEDAWDKFAALDFEEEA